MDIQTLNTLILGTFFILVLAGGIRTVIRYFEYLDADREVPVLLIRDIISRNGLAISFLLILTARVLDVGEHVRDQVWWILLTSGPALIGAATYAYFEFFVIDKQDRVLPFGRRADD